MDDEDVNEELLQGIKAKQEYQSFGGTSEELQKRNITKTPT